MNEQSRYAALEKIFPGDGEMARRMREYAWERSPLGDPCAWPASLVTAVHICLTSRFPIVLWWGKELRLLYNDAWRPVLGTTKHPRALASLGRDVWPEIWHIIGPMLEGVLKKGEATWSDDQLLPLDRNGYLEEAYFTYSYSPIPGERGGVGGVFAAVNETTVKVLAERRLRTLRELAAQTLQAKGAIEAARMAMATLSANASDVPFALLYLVDADGRARLEQSSPAGVESTDGRWPVAEAVEHGEAILLQDLHTRIGTLPSRWPVPPKHALVLPLRSAAQGRVLAVLILGVNPARELDDEHRGFLDMAARHIANSVANACAYAEERRRAEVLAELDHAKTTFFSNVSHEFRTPLTLMLGPIEDILAKPAHEVLPTNRAALEVVHRNGQRLLKLVNTLLDFARIEAGRAQASYEPIDLAESAAELASNFRSACERAGLRLIMDCPPLEEAGWVDRQMWEKIVLNLLSNAFKFTFEGEIAVSLRRTQRSFELVVRDTGTGIPADSLPHIFERFHRVIGARGRSHEGSGIGLALVQELVRLHGGTICVESEVGEGTTFTVCLPRGNAHLSPERILAQREAVSTAARAGAFVDEALSWLPSKPKAEPPAMGGPRVLLADDNADLREYVRGLLAERYDVETAADGAAALAAARERKPDLVLTDMMMPVLDGLGLIRELRADAALREVPVIALSARAGEEARIEGLEKGADDYLTKPFSGRELLVRVEALLRSGQIRRDAEAGLRESEQRLRLALEAGRLGSWEWHIPTNRVIWSPALEAMHGIAPGSFPGTFEAYQHDIHPEDRASVARSIGDTLLGRDHHIEYRIVLPDGSVRWVEGRGKLFRDAHGDPLRIVGVCSDVTERRQAQEALRSSEERLRAIVETTPECVKLVARDGTLLQMNAAGLAMVGAERTEAVVGGCVYDVIAPEDRRRFREFNERICNGERGTLQFDIVGLGGVRRHMETHAVPLAQPGGGYAQLAVTRDITERMRAEEAVRSNEKRNRAVLSLMPAAVYTCDAPSGVISYYNEHAAALWGRAPRLGDTDERFCGSFRLWLPDGTRLPHDQTPMAVAMRENREFRNREVVVERPDGSRLTVLVNIDPVRDAEGRVVGAINVFHDVTERRAAEERLRRHEQELSDFFETAAIGLHWVGPDGIIIRANRAELEMLGYASEEYVGRHIADFYVDRSVIDDILARLTRGEVLREYPACMRCRDGSVRDVLITGSVLFENGKFVHTRCFTLDVTARKRAETGLHARARQQQAVARLGELALGERDLQKVFDRTTAAVAETLEVEYCKVLELLPGGKEVLLRAGVGWKEGLVGSARVSIGMDSQAGYTLASRSPVVVRDLRIEQRFRGPRLLTEHGVVSGMSCIIRGAEGEVWGVLGTHATRLIEFTGDDVSFLTAVANILGHAIQRERAEAALRESDRRKDEFIAMLSHELRNPLAPLRSALEVLGLRSGAGNDDIRMMMERQVNHLVRLVDDLLETSRISRGLLELRREPVQVADMLRSAVESAEPLVREFGHRLQLHLPSEPLWLRGDPVRLAQSFANLLNNAARYTPRGGNIWLRATREGDTAVCVSVRDSGAGFTKETKARLFEMFSRGDGSSGLGVGLALVRKLIEMHGGSVEAHSEGVGHGAEFRVRLPLDRAPAGAVRAKTVHAGGRTYRVLVADDNRDAAESLAMLLRALGNEVSVAADGVEAVQAVPGFRPHLALLDIGMPKLDGYGAARQIRRHPLGAQIRLVALTGWGQEEDRRRAREAGFDSHLVKPAELDALRRVLAEVKPEDLQP